MKDAVTLDFIEQKLAELMEKRDLDQMRIDARYAYRFEQEFLDNKKWVDPIEALL